MTTHNTHKRKISMPPAGFEPTIPAIEQPQTHPLDRADIGVGLIWFRRSNYEVSACPEE